MSQDFNFSYNSDKLDYELILPVGGVKRATFKTPYSDRPFNTCKILRCHNQKFKQKKLFRQRLFE